MIAYGLGLSQAADLAYNLASQSGLDGGATIPLPDGYTYLIYDGQYVTTDSGEFVVLD